MALYRVFEVVLQGDSLDELRWHRCLVDNLSDKNTYYVERFPFPLMLKIPVRRCLSWRSSAGPQGREAVRRIIAHEVIYAYGICLCQEVNDVCIVDYH